MDARYEELDKIQYSEMTVPVLKELLRGRGLSVTGKKSELVKRLEQDDIAKEQAAGWWRVSIRSIVGAWTTVRCKEDWTVKQLIEEYCRISGTDPRCIRGLYITRYDFVSGEDFEEKLDEDRTLKAQAANVGNIRADQSLRPVRE
jgi:hypothetical protein